jgi:hypothetical protein
MKTNLINPQKNIIFLSIIIIIIVITLFIFPNSKGSDDISMVQMFEPDEAVLIPYIFRMIEPAQNLYQFIHHFIFYDYYFYGFPFFAFSALALLPVQSLAQLNNIPLVMVLLRQLISVLPMVAAILILVYMQDGFRTYRSPVLLIFLLSIPAVIQNNFWWHPDGLTILFVVITIFFLKKDNLQLGKYFLFAAIMTGLAASIKLVGFYFFLAIGLTLLLSFISKRTSWKRILVMGTAYILIMGLMFLIANPFLISHWARTTYLSIFIKQTALLSEGYGIEYAKGIFASWPLFAQYYGGYVFILIAIGTTIWGAIFSPRRLLQALIIAWFIPITITLVFFIHFKFQYWLPVALPLFSSLVLLLPTKLKEFKSTSRSNILRSFLLFIILIQFLFFLQTDVKTYLDRISRADNNPRIEFFDNVSAALGKESQLPLNVYYDYRLYVPKTLRWNTSTSYDLLNYDYIKKGNFDVLILLEQRIKDYLNPNAVGIDPIKFDESKVFYQDAEKGSILGFHLLFRNPVGLVFIRDQ